MAKKTRGDRSLEKKQALVDVAKADKKIDKCERELLRLSDPVKIAEKEVELQRAKNERAAANKKIRPPRNRKNEGKKKKKGKKGTFLGSLGM